ncbi:MAG: branched-chain alpha-keto acid dehydrogenase subunit E2 [Firmicutes bacterium ZCTH02-B6]|nr:MAG: branched-chain alpha-keto acid dehydrogenase subunit E2 [Firmicutes bacterium ZCTH02-B6]
MSLTTVTMPQLGESVVEGTIGAWLKAVGDRVEKYEPLVEVITDKVNTEIPSPVSGVVQEILVEAGATVKVGTPICVLAADEPAGAAETSAAVRDAAQARSQGAPGAGGEALPRGVYSPLVRRLAAEYAIDLRQVKGTGAGGRVTKRDVLAYVAEQGRQAAGHAAAPSPTAAGAAAAGAPAAAPAPALGLGAEATPALAEVAAAPAGPDEVVTPADPMRRAIAQRMAQSKQTIPHAWTMMEVDVTRLVALREGMKEEFRRREGVDLTYVPFFVKAVVESLKDFPLLNASWQDDRIVVKKRIHIGVAVGLEDGLVVPVIRDADRLSIAGLARSLADLVSRARAGKLTVDDVQGATITVNNTGAFGSVASYPIISPPQAAIITMEAIVRRPVVIGDAIGIRSMMNICLSFDHRVTDGLYAGRFLQSVKRRLEGFGPDTAVY